MVIVKNIRVKDYVENNQIENVWIIVYWQIRHLGSAVDRFAGLTQLVPTDKEMRAL